MIVEIIAFTFEFIFFILFELVKFYLLLFFIYELIWLIFLMYDGETATPTPSETFLMFKLTNTGMGVTVGPDGIPFTPKMYPFVVEMPVEVTNPNIPKQRSFRI